MPEFNDLIAALAAETHLPDLRADEDGFCVLQADTVPLSVINLPEAGIVYITAEIGDSPKANAETFYATMLEANCRFEGTAGGTLARSPETGKLLLTRYARLSELTAESFIAIISGLINAAELWQKLLEAGNTEGETPAQNETPQAPDDTAGTVSCEIGRFDAGGFESGGFKAGSFNAGGFGGSGFMRI